MNEDDKPVEVLSIHCDTERHQDCPDEVELTMNGVTYLIFKCSCPCHNRPDRKIKAWNTEGQLDEFLKKLRKK